MASRLVVGDKQRGRRGWIGSEFDDEGFKKEGFLLSVVLVVVVLLLTPQWKLPMDKKRLFINSKWMIGILKNWSERAEEELGEG